MYCLLTAKTVDTQLLLLKSCNPTRTKNPECESIRDFYFLPFHSSLFTKTTLNGAVLLDKYFDIIVLFQNNH